MSPVFRLGERLAVGTDFVGRLEAIYIDAEGAYAAQITRRRIRLRHQLATQSFLWRPNLRPGDPPLHWQPHVFLLESGGRMGAMASERVVRPAGGRTLAITSPRYELGEWIVEPYGRQVMVRAIYRQFSSAVAAGVVSPGWFDAQERRPATRLQPFYACEGMLVGEAEATPMKAARARGRKRAIRT